MLFRVFAGLIAALLLCPSAVAQDRQWAWFVAISNINDWTVAHGLAADVKMTERGFTANLLEGSFVRHELRGTRAGASLRVKMSTNETDLVDFPLQGTYKRTSWENADESGSAGREHIILSGEGIVVGLTREIPKRSNPGVQRPPEGGRR